MIPVVFDYSDLLESIMIIHSALSQRH